MLTIAHGAVPFSGHYNLIQLPYGAIKFLCLLLGHVCAASRKIHFALDAVWSISAHATSRACANAHTCSPVNAFLAYMWSLGHTPRRTKQVGSSCSMPSSSNVICDFNMKINVISAPTQACMPKSLETRESCPNSTAQIQKLNNSIVALSTKVLLLLIELSSSTSASVSKYKNNGCSSLSWSHGDWHKSCPSRVWD